MTGHPLQQHPDVTLGPRAAASPAPRLAQPGGLACMWPEEAGSTSVNIPQEIANSAVPIQRLFFKGLRGGVGGRDAKAQKSERWEKGAGKTQPISAETLCTRGCRPTVVRAPRGRRREEGMRRIGLHFIAARALQSWRELSKTRPRSGRRAPGELAGGRRAGCAPTGRRRGRARWDPWRHRRGVPPSVTWVQRVADVQLRGPGDAVQAVQRPGRSSGRCGPQTRGRCTWPGW